MSETATPSRPPLALIANDQEWSARALESILTPKGYAVLRAYSGEVALERAGGAQPDLVILDLNLPDIPGIELCRALRNESRVGATTPILITTAAAPSRRQRMEALRAGAWELLGLPVDAEIFSLKVDAFVRAKLAADRARETNLVDPLSELYNARGLLRRAREIGAEARRHRQPLACVVFAPEPEFGEAEETAARLLASVFRESGRRSDTIGRLGPTEFLVLAPAADATNALRLANRLVEAVEKASRAGPVTAAPLRVCAGYFAVGDLREEPLEPADILLRAVTALRRAQSEPRGDRIRFYDGDGETTAQ